VGDAGLGKGLAPATRNAREEVKSCIDHFPEMKSRNSPSTN
jgi:hypothetical protein